MSPHGKRQRNSARHNKEHAVERAQERYGIQLSNKKRKTIAILIEDGKGNFLGRGNMAQRKIYGLSIDGQRLKVVYDHYTRRIVTFLPNGKGVENGAT